MAEVLGVASAIIGLACLGVQLSKHLYHFGAHTVGLEADHKINRTATNITLFSSMLKHVATVMGESNSLHTPEAVDTVMQIVRECELVFNEIGKILRLSSEGAGDMNGQTRGLKRSMSLGRRVKMYFDQPKVDSLLAQLEYLKTTLSVLIQTLHLAAVTQHLKETNQSIQERTEQINEERIHVETLLIARHLSIVILNQHDQQRRASAEEEGYVETVGRISPADSEATVDTSGPKLLTAGPGSSFSLVRQQGRHLDFLDTAMEDEDDVTSPTTSRMHDPLIDRLLGKWTKLPELRRPPIKKFDTSQREYRSMTLGHVEEKPTNSADIKPQNVSEQDNLPLDHSARSETIHELESNATTLVPSPPLSPNTGIKTGSDPLLGPPQDNISSQRLVARSPSPHVNLSHVLKDSPSATGYFAVTPVNAAASGRRGTSISKSQVVFEEPSSMLTEEERIYSSPQPLSTPSITTSKPPEMSSLSQSASVTGPPPQNANGSSQARPPKLASTSAAPSDKRYQAHVSPAFESRGSFDSDTEYEIPWRIRIGPKYWDFLDKRLVGPKNPDLPTESLSQLQTNDYANTEIADLWASEAAIVEKGYPYRRIASSEDGESPDEIRWRIFAPLKFEDIQALVNRTNELERLKPKASPSASMTPSVPIAPQPIRANTQTDLRFFASPPTLQTGSYYSQYQQPAPPPYTDMRSQYPQRPASLHSQWPTYPGAMASVMNPMAPTPANSSQIRSPSIQQRTVSFANNLTAPQGSGTRGSNRHSSIDRSPRSSTDFSAQQQQQQPQQRPPLPQQQSGGYWPPPPPGQAATSPALSQTYSTFSGASIPLPASPYMLGPGGVPMYPMSPQQQQQQQQQPAPGQGQWSYPPPQQTQRYDYPPSSRYDDDQRDRRRERSRSRSSSRSRSRSGDRDRDRERERERSRRKKDREKQKKDEKGTEFKKKSKVAAGTLGVIGGLAGLLEGLDGI